MAERIMRISWGYIYIYMCVYLVDTSGNLRWCCKITPHIYIYTYNYFYVCIYIYIYIHMKTVYIVG